MAGVDRIGCQPADTGTTTTLALAAMEIDSLGRGTKRRRNLPEALTPIPAPASNWQSGEREKKRRESVFSTAFAIEWPRL